MTPRPAKDLLQYKPHRDVLAMVGRYHYVTSKQVTRLLYSPTYPTYANKLLKDLTDREYLHMRNWIPKGPSAGQPERVWSLAPRGYRALADMGIEVAMRMRYTVDRSQYFMAHTQAVNDTLIASELFALEHPTVALTGFLHEQALKRERLTPTPDGWVHYTIGEETGSTLWEIDRGTEDRRKWQAKMIAYIELLESPQDPLGALIGDDAVQIGVVVRSNPTQRTKAPHERCEELLQWTEQALSSDWGPLFAFTPVDPVSVSPTSFFTDLHWFTPHSDDPRPLIPKERL